MKSQSMNTKPLGLKVLAVAVGTLALAACGEEQATYTAAEEAKAKEMGMKQCLSVGGSEALCECTVAKMKSMKKEDYAMWVKLAVAAEGSTSAQESAEKTGMSEEELTKIASHLAVEGMRVGMQCEQELAQ